LRCAPKASTIATAGTDTGTGEETLASYSLPGGTLDTGEQLVIRAVFSTAANGNNKTMKVYFGASSISSGTVTGNAKTTSARMDVVKTGTATQFVPDLALQVPHLLAAHRKALLSGQLGRALQRDLADQRCWQQLLLYSQRNQVLVCRGIDQTLFVGRFDPATAPHLKVTAGSQRPGDEFLLQIDRRQRPVGGKFHQQQIAEQHAVGLWQSGEGRGV
jgi:hypothetical protein